MKTNSKDTLCDAIRAIKAQLVKTPEDEARFRAEANFFVRQALENTGFVRTKLSHCVDLFKSVFSSGLSWDPRAHHVSLILAEDMSLTVYVHYHGQIKMASHMGVIERVTADLIYETDQFEFCGADTQPRLRRKISREGLGEAIGGYSVSYLQGGALHVELLDIEALEKAEAAGDSYGNSEFWTGPHRREMQRKSIINATARRWLELSNSTITQNCAS